MKLALKGHKKLPWQSQTKQRCLRSLQAGSVSKSLNPCGKKRLCELSFVFPRHGVSWLHMCWPEIMHAHTHARARARTSVVCWSVSRHTFWLQSLSKRCQSWYFLDLTVHPWLGVGKVALNSICLLNFLCLVSPLVMLHFLRYLQIQQPIYSSWGLTWG